MNYLALCQALVKEAGISGSGPASVTGQIGELGRVVRWIAKADTDIQKLHRDWTFLWGEYTFTTLAGTREYSAANAGQWPAHLGRWVTSSAVLERGSATARPLAYRDWADWQAHYGWVAPRQGPPVLFTVKPDKSLVLTDTPDDAYSVYLEYNLQPYAMVANDDVSPIPADYHEIIVQRALLDYARFEAADEILPVASAAYQEWLSALEDACLPNQGDAWGVTQADAPLIVRTE